MTTYLKDYRPTNFTIDNINLEFDIYADYVLVKNIMALTRVSVGALCLHGDQLNLISLKLNNIELSKNSYQIQNDELTIETNLDKFALEIVTRLEPQKNTKLAGLFKTNSILCTQCEAHGFRRITYFYDRPDVLTTYTTKITADKALFPVLLSNGNLIESGNLPDNKHYVIWHDPFKKPSYLFALVAGQLEHIQDKFVTCSGKSIDLRIYVEPKDIHKCEHAMRSLKNAMRWDEEVYGREYDLATFMIVAVSDFNMGAMENKGLNIFNSKFILGTKESATDADFADIEGVVAHEYFHNWTGNRITCRDWFQLSLKEGLTVFRDQEFSRDMNSRSVNRIQDVRSLRGAQFPEDAGAMAHPVRPTSYQEINNFYTATIYNKGAEVIRMQHTLLGAKGFRRGMDLYFQRHDGHAVTIDDFVKAMEDANSCDLTQFKYWYDKPGTPVVTVTSTFNNNTLKLTFTQTCRKTPDDVPVQAFHIPIKYALFDESGKQIDTGSEVIELREFTQTFEFHNLATKPIISLLRDFSAPIILKNDNNFQELQKVLKFETDGFAKWDAAQSLAKQFLISSYQNQNINISQDLLDCFKHILTDESLDCALRAEILTLPSFEDLANEIHQIDVEKALNVRDSFRKAIAASLYNEAKVIYQNLWSNEKHDMQNNAYGPRKLRNICLQFMFLVNEEEAINFCETQFTQAQTMTDKLASLSLLAKHKSTQDTALNSFYQDWQDDGLVIDKWFTVQAAADTPEVLTNIKTLVNHKDFIITNPNRVRSLVVAFTQANPRYFHAKDGSGYEFLTAMILKIDKINPQLSSRLATPFTRWQRLSQKYQDLIQKELKLLSTKELSVDLGELVFKSLKQ